MVAPPQGRWISKAKKPKREWLAQWYAWVETVFSLKFECNEIDMMILRQQVTEGQWI
jgi:hypothetical protein